MAGISRREWPSAVRSRTSPRTVPPETTATLSRPVAGSTARTLTPSLYFRPGALKKVGILPGAGGCPDYPFGFDTAMNVVRDAGDRLHTTAESHHRVMVVEVMGRRSGWIATLGGLAGGADFILIPEKPYRLEDMCAVLESRRRRGRHFSIVVVAEGAFPAG